MHTHRLNIKMSSLLLLLLSLLAEIKCKNYQFDGCTYAQMLLCNSDTHMCIGLWHTRSVTIGWQSCLLSDTPCLNCWLTLRWRGRNRRPLQRWSPNWWYHLYLPWMGVQVHSWWPLGWDTWCQVARIFRNTWIWNTLLKLKGYKMTCHTRHWNWSCVMGHEGIGKSNRSPEGRSKKVWLLSVTVDKCPSLCAEIPSSTSPSKSPAHGLPRSLHRPLTCYCIPCAPFLLAVCADKGSLSHHPTPGNNFIFYWELHTAGSAMCPKLGKSLMTSPAPARWIIPPLLTLKTASLPSSQCYNL